MGVLIRADLARRIAKNELIHNPRRTPNGEVELQPASYDLTAGRAVWKEQSSLFGHSKGSLVREALFRAGQPYSSQPYVVLQPGQMVSVITHEEVAMPLDLCGTVFSKNRLALNGVFAFNAGHVDPGFVGPIVIRLINLRASPWTFTMGDRIFTIVFETLEHLPSDELASRPPMTADETLQRVRHFTDVALSNALFDLYSQTIEERLGQHKMEMLEVLRDDLRKEFLRTDQLGHALWGWLRKNALAVLGFIGLCVGILKGLPPLLSFLKRLWP